MKKSKCLTRDGKHLTVDGVYHIAQHVFENTMVDKELLQSLVDVLDMINYTDGSAKLVYNRFEGGDEMSLELIVSKQRIATREYYERKPAPYIFSGLCQEVLDKYEVNPRAIEVIEKYYPRIFD